MIDGTKIMQYADGTLPEEEKEAVEKAIESNPELKKLFKDYQETADLLFNLGKSIKSQPLPKSLKEKLKVLNETQEKVIKIKKPFTFFNIFKVQYAGIAAALAVFFYGGFYTQGVMMAKKNGTEMQAVGKKMDKKIKITSDNLSTRIANVYKFFDEEKFTDEVNNVITDLNEGDEFELSLKDANGNIIKFVLVKNFESEDGFQCKDIAFKKKTLLSRTDLGTDLKLSMCKKDDRYKLVSINLSK
jgi:hypothetical protein